MKYLFERKQEHDTCLAKPGSKVQGNMSTPLDDFFLLNYNTSILYELWTTLEKFFSLSSTNASSNVHPLDPLQPLQLHEIR